MLGLQTLQTFVLSALVLGTVDAGRIDTVARNKGFHPNLKRSLESRAPASSAKEEITYHYRNAGSERRSCNSEDYIDLGLT